MSIQNGRQCAVYVVKLKCNKHTHHNLYEYFRVYCNIEFDFKSSFGRGGYVLGLARIGLDAKCVIKSILPHRTNHGINGKKTTKNSRSAQENPKSINFQFRCDCDMTVRCR